MAMYIQAILIVPAPDLVIGFCRVWDALMLAAFFNMQSGFYYELFSNFMGKGDKESFAFAFAATRTPYYKVPHQVGSLGQMRSYCRQGCHSHSIVSQGLGPFKK